MNDIARPSQRPGLADGLRHQRLMTPLEVANLFRVDPKTVTRWANKGWLPRVRTLGGHSRFKEVDILAHMERSRKERTP